MLMSVLTPVAYNPFEAKANDPPTSTYRHKCHPYVVSHPSLPRKPYIPQLQAIHHVQT